MLRGQRQSSDAELDRIARICDHVRPNQPRGPNFPNHGYLVVQGDLYLRVVTTSLTQGYP
eukprot:3747175-Prymnesium_polylepis.1